MHQIETRRKPDTLRIREIYAGAQEIVGEYIAERAASDLLRKIARSREPPYLTARLANDERSGGLRNVIQQSQD
jgi:hypothetical protein